VCETLNKAKADAAKAKPARRLSAEPAAKKSIKQTEFWVFGTGQMMSVDYLFDRLSINVNEPTAAYTCDYSVDGLVGG